MIHLGRRRPVISLMVSIALTSIGCLVAMPAMPRPTATPTATVTPVLAAAVPMHFARLGGDTGLSQGGIMAVLQDRQGFLWLGTEDGLDRYDGYELRHYISDHSRSNSLPNNWVSALAEGSAGTLWIGTDGGGLVGLNPVTGKFEKLPLITKQAPLGAQEKIRVLYSDRHGRLWVGTRDSGLVMIDQARAVIRRFRSVASDAATLSSDSVSTVLEDRAGAIWVGTHGGLDRLDPISGRIEHQNKLLSALAAPLRKDLQVNALLEDRAGNLWVGMNDALLRRKPGAVAATVYLSRSSHSPGLPGERIQAMLEDSAQRLWIGTATGLALYDRQADRFSSYRHSAVDPTTLPDDDIVSLYEDHGGILWVGTKTGGIAKWTSRSWSFGHHRGDVANGLSDGNTTAFAVDADGTIWISSFGGGLDALDRRRGVTTHYQHHATDPASLPDNRVMSLLLDHEGVLWVGTMTEGLSRLDRGSGRFTRYRHDPNDPSSLSAPGVMSLLEDSRGRIWAGTFGGGVSVLDRSTGKFTRYNANPNDPRTLSSDRATALAEDRTGNIWIGTDGGGLCLLDPTSGRVVRYAHMPEKPRSLSANTVYALRVDDGGHVWVGTRGGGLDEVVGSAAQPEAIEFRNFSEAQGLPNTTIYGIEIDRGGHLWLSTNRGLSRFDPAKAEIRNFSRAHGLQGDEFNFGAHFRSAAGELFFGGPGGYNAFFPERLQFNNLAPPVVLTSFLKLNEPAQTNVPYERLSNIALGYRDNVVTFEFAALDFASPEDNRYAYRLEGFDRGWVDAGSRRRVNYTNLAAGHYTFQVRAANSDGKWNEVGLAIPLSVEPPPWARWWARLSYALAAALLIFAVWNRQQNKLREEARHAQRLEQEVRDRTAELALRNQELERVNSQLKEASVTDPLTGLGNRRYLRDAMTGLIAAAGQAPPAITMLVVDLDRLKPINDQHGHEAGDQVLLQVAEILRHCCRTNDFIARWGGDEFVIIYQGAELNDAELLAERIRSRVAKQIFRLSDGKAARSSCSIGFTRFPFVAEAPGLLSWEQSLAVADIALYHAKKLRNGWVGMVGTAAAIAHLTLLKAIDQDADGLEREGVLEVRRPKHRPEDTVNNLRVQGLRRGDP